MASHTDASRSPHLVTQALGNGRNGSSGQFTSQPYGHARRTLLVRLGAALNRLPQSFFSRYNQLLIDVALSVASFGLAFLLRFDGEVPPQQMAVLWPALLAIAILRPGSKWFLGGYRAIWRYFGMRDAFNLALTALPATLLLAVLRLTLAGQVRWFAIPLGVIAIDYLLFVALATAARALRRITFEAAQGTGGRRRCVMVGSPDTLAEALRRSAHDPDLHIVSLLAPDNKVHGMRIGGFTVQDEPAALGRMLAEHAVDVVLIADAGLPCIGEMVSTATEFGVDVRLLPTAGNVLRGDVRISAPPSPERIFAQAATVAEPHPDVVAAFRDRVVLVTGAGGSIGSELARQVLQLPVRTLILLDHDENSIFEIGNELTATSPRARLVRLVGDIRDTARMRRVFDAYRPQIVLHAAAYKHVPVMEYNCSEAVLNNVFGTRVLAELAVEFLVERFLMISTDKAVHPSSVMGATKRVAEVLVQAAARRSSRTRMACVRFGNVVGSRGSVVPIFLRQIAEGRPVTITDENMTRYFMTIPEAVQLVLQASTLGSHGDVYMLDMGDPIKIMALARKLIEMSGLRPDADVPIHIVGARPGEKIAEELWSAGAQVDDTRFARVMAVKAEPVPEGFDDMLEALQACALEGHDARAREMLRAMPIGYTEERALATAAHD